jgi:branched-chain amino acid transport system ATP-binding protein
VTTDPFADRSGEAVAAPGMAMLEVRDLRVAYGKIEAVKGISFRVDAGQLVTLIGGNGAGKTTTLRTLSGLLPVVSGEIWFEGRRLNGVPAHEVVKLGLAHSPEGRKIFPRMSVAENLELGAFVRNDRDGVERDKQHVYELFPVLGERATQAAGTLSGGEQQMLAMGRAMMSKPRLLMLDEPSMGLSPIMMEKIFSTIRTLMASGTTILLVEQNAQAALSLADYGYVIETGTIVLEDEGRKLLGNEQVRKAYLGEE